MKTVFYILSTGSEITSGKSLDTNSMWIANQLTDIGMTIDGFVSIPDSVNLLESEIKRISELDKNTFIIMTGGMGATGDDHTLNVIQKLTESSLRRIDYAYEKLVSSSERRGKEYVDLLPITSRQTYIPENAIYLTNEIGIAPGFLIELNKNSKIAALPGVPVEMKSIFEKYLLPIIKSEVKNSNKIYTSKYIWTMTEGLYQKNFINKNNEFFKKNSMEWGVTAKPGHIKVSFQSENKEDINYINNELQKQYQGLLTDNIQDEIHNLLVKFNKTISTAESCTGGYIGKLLTDRAGSSNYYLGSIISYHNTIKEKILNIKKSTLEQYGAVSKETATEMADNCIQLMDSDFCISVTGIAGPGGGSSEKPVGLVYIGIKAKGKEAIIYQHNYPFGREIFREAVTNVSLFYLYKEIKTHTGRMI